MLLGAWLLHSVRLAAALGMAIVAMQAPAVTREYQAALLQLVRSSGEDIARRKASAQRFYDIPIENEERFMARLRAVEPSNAETLAGAVEREKSLRASYSGSSATRTCGARSPPPEMFSTTTPARAVRSPKRCSKVLWRNSICRSPQPSTGLRACSWAR